MALDENLLLDIENGSSGQEFMTAINAIVKNTNAVEEEYKNRFERIETDGFHIGDIRNSCRNDLGNKYLLCNGQYICSFDGYEDLVKIMHNFGYDNKLTTTYKNSKEDGDIECLIYKESIYIFYPVKGDGVYVRKFNTVHDFIKNNYSVDCKIHSINSNRSLNIKAQVFKEKLCLLICWGRTSESARDCNICFMSIDTDELNNNFNSSNWNIAQLDSSTVITTKLEEAKFGRYTIVYNNDNLTICLPVGGERQTYPTMKYFVTFDGINFNMYNGGVPSNYLSMSASTHTNVFAKQSSDGETIEMCMYNNYDKKYHLFSYTIGGDTDTLQDASDFNAAPALIGEVIDLDNSLKQQENEDIQLFVEEDMIKMIPKTFTVSAIPNIPTDTMYSFIKAKE